ncbi:MAG: hypothetical protein JW839_05050 [Candidatus Lokiarchaeota archaeon]|nr:hypothetical protein [Candidatus Lokiarchaeota archaeon]
MEEKPVSGKKSSWEAAIKEQLRKHPDPADFQADVIRIMLEMLPAPADSVPRAIDKHHAGGRSGFLVAVFGDAARVKVIEALLQHPDDWFNLHELATISGTGKASAKRIVDELLASKLGIVEEKAREGKEVERLVKLSGASLARELRFFYSKLRGML